MPTVTNEIDYNQLDDIYRERFRHTTLDHRKELWRVLCRHWMQKYVPKDATVLDLAAGYCEFINQIECKEKIAVDLNEDIRNFAASDVRVVLAYSHNMSMIESDSVDVVFVSNFFEHLPAKQVFLETLYEIKRILKVGGKVLILQPNIRFLAGEYWDFIDHYLPLTDRSVVEALLLVGMQIDEVRPRFLPYTTRSRLPQWSFLVRLYLLMPWVHRIFGRQAWIVSSKTK